MSVIWLFLSLNQVLANAPIDYSSPQQVQPYIESLNQKYGISQKSRPPEPESSARSTTPPPSDKPAASTEYSKDPQLVQPYIEKLRGEQGLNPSTESAPGAVGGGGQFSNSPREVQPYIESLKGGHELEAQYRKKVDSAAGFAVVTSNKFNITSDKVQANTFESVYTPNEKYSPSLDLFYEKHLYRNHYVGAIGLAAQLNVIFTKGKGVFTKTGTPSLDTQFRFYAMPFSIGGVYRFTQLRYIQPFLKLEAVGIPFIETRNDNHPSRRGISRGYEVVPGFALNLDWIARKDAWEQYDMHGILHTYLLLQADFMRTIAGPVAFNYDGLYAGLLFEF